MAEWPVVLALVVLESLLSGDNALVLAAMVEHLKPSQRKLALRAGLLGAYIMRGASIFGVYYILHFSWIKLIGGAYLGYLACKKIGADEDDEQKKLNSGFWHTVLMVELMDMMFSIDNIAASAAYTKNIYVILTGVFIGIAAMRFVAGLLVAVIEKYPILKQTAYVLVGWIGVQLYLEYFFNLNFGEMFKFATVLAIVGGSLVYDKVPAVKNALTPAFELANKGMKLFSGAVDNVFGHIFHPFGKAAA